MYVNMFTGARVESYLFGPGIVIYSRPSQSTKGVHRAVVVIYDQVMTISMNELSYYEYVSLHEFLYALRQYHVYCSKTGDDPMRGIANDSI